MDIWESLQQTLAIDIDMQGQLLEFAFRLGWFIGLTLVAIVVGRSLPSWFQWGMTRFAPNFLIEPYERIITPLRLLIIRSGFLVITALNINLFRPYPGLYEFLKLVVYLPLTIMAAWLLSRLVRQVVRLYGVKIIQNFNSNMDDFLLIGESVANLVIGFFAVIFFAQIQSINLMSLLTGVGIGGIAVAFAAKEILSQVVGTVLIYLDRPYVPGEYVRANFNPRDPEDIYGRVESIGIRSTKIRLAAKNTLLIAPNSLMARMHVENISRGKKVMILFYLDFTNILNESENALVYKVIEESLHKELSDVDSSSTQVVLFENEEQATRARISLFVKGASEKSIMIRKRLVEIANQSITERLQIQGLQFEFAEPTIYVDAPMTL